MRPAPAAQMETKINVDEVSDSAFDDRARRAAKRVGFIAKKSRYARSNFNCGGFRLVDPETNLVVAGARFDLTAQQVIDFCAEPKP